MFEIVKADLRRSIPANTGSLRRELMHPGTQAVLVHRFGFWARRLKVPLVRHFVIAVHWMLHVYVEAVSGVYIAIQADIGPGLVIHTWQGIFVGPCKIGRNLNLSHGVVIHWKCKAIGDDVYIGPGAKVISPGVTIGDRARIGANAVVVSDVPDDSMVTAPASRVWRLPRASSEEGEPDPALFDEPPV